jgi:hypothetical protein
MQSDEAPQRPEVPVENVKQEKSAVSGRGSRAAAAIESAWDRLRDEIPGLPAAIMVIYHAAVHRCGHFAPSCWKYDAQRRAHEVGITPNLFETPEELLAAC